MDRLQQKQIRAEPCGPKVQPGRCALTKVGPPPQLTVQEPPPISPAGVLKKPPELNLPQAAAAPGAFTDKLQSGQPRPGSTPATLASISRPRPTALGTKLAPKTTRISVDPSKEIHLVPVCIPGPQSANVLPHSPTESSLPLSSPQSPHSPQSSTSQPHLSPSPTLGSKPSLCPERAASPGTSTKGDARPEKPVESDDFR